MPRPLLPPNYINCTRVDLLFDRTMPPAVFHTWLQLRALAWNKAETPELSIEQLVDMTGKSRSTLYGHMRLLETRTALRWRTASSSMLIFSFNDSNSGLDGQSRNLDDQDIGAPECSGDDDAGAVPVNDQSRKLDSESRKLDSQSRNLDKPSLSHVCLSEIHERERAVQKSGQSRNLDRQLQREFEDRLYQICRLDRDLVSHKTRMRVSESATKLITRGVQIEQLVLFESNWYAHDYRGKKDSPPHPQQVCDTWEIIMKPGGNGNGKHTQGDPESQQSSGDDQVDRNGINPALAALARRAGE